MKTMSKTFKGSCAVFFSICLVLLASVGFSFDSDYHYRPAAHPDRIILNLTQDPSISMAVTWRTDNTVSQSLVQWIESGPGPKFESAVQSTGAQTQRFVNRYEGEPEFEALQHSAILSGLNPSTQYMYRVGDGQNWSEWLQFKTAGDKVEAFSFLYFGDAQNSLKSHWSRLIREAFRTAPHAGFSFHAGDLINRSGSDREWGEWFECGSFIHAMIPSIMTPGNHEYNDQELLDRHWRPQFTLPENGVPGLEETCFYVDYQDLRIISIDAEMLDEVPEFETAQAVWLDSILTDNPQKWTAVTLHFPFYSTKPNRDNPRLREVFRPIIEKHGVDIVLQGHDHAYGRGMLGIPSAVNKNQSSNTMYIVSVSGPKMYDISDREWMSRRARDTQLFQVITIDNDTLSFEAYTANGELYDAFDLLKQADGSNKLFDKVPAMPERLSQ